MAAVINALLFLALACLLQKTTVSAFSVDQLPNVIQEKVTEIKNEVTGVMSQIDNRVLSVADQLNGAAADIEKQSVVAKFVIIKTRIELGRLESSLRVTSNILQSALTKSSNDVLGALKKELENRSVEIDSLEKCVTKNGVTNFNDVVNDLIKKEFNQQLEPIEKIEQVILLKLDEDLQIVDGFPNDIKNCADFLTARRESQAFLCIRETVKQATEKARNIEQQIKDESKRAFDLLNHIRAEIPAIVTRVIKQAEEEFKKQGVDLSTCAL